MANQFEMFASAQGKPKEGLLKTWREMSAWRCELYDLEAVTTDSAQAHVDEKERELTLSGFLF